MLTVTVAIRLCCHHMTVSHSQTMNQSYRRCLMIYPRMRRPWGLFVLWRTTNRWWGMFLFMVFLFWLCRISFAGINPIKCVFVQCCKRFKKKKKKWKQIPLQFEISHLSFTKIGERRRGSLGDGVEVLRSRWSNLRRLTLKHLAPARRAWSGEELRASESNARLLSFPKGGQPRPFLPRYQSTGSCCLCPQTEGHWKKGRNQSAPSVFSPATWTGKRRDKLQSMRSPVIPGYIHSLLAMAHLSEEVASAHSSCFFSPKNDCSKFVSSLFFPSLGFFLIFKIMCLLWSPCVVDHFQVNPGMRVGLLEEAVRTTLTLLHQSQHTVLAFPTLPSCTKKVLWGHNQGTFQHQEEPPLVLVSESAPHHLVLQLSVQHDSKGWALSLLLTGNTRIKRGLKTKSFQNFLLRTLLLRVTIDATSNQNRREMCSSSPNTIGLLSLLSCPNSAAWRSSGPPFRQWPALFSTAVRTYATLARKWWQQPRLSQTTWKRMPRRSACLLRWSTSSRGSLWLKNTRSHHRCASQSIILYLLQGSPLYLQRWSANLPHRTLNRSHLHLPLAPRLPQLHPRSLVQMALQCLSVQSDWMEPLIRGQVFVAAMDKWGSTELLWRTNKNITAPAAWKQRRKITALVVIDYRPWWKYLQVFKSLWPRRLLDKCTSIPTTTLSVLGQQTLLRDCFSCYWSNPSKLQRRMLKGTKKWHFVHLYFPFSSYHPLIKFTLTVLDKLFKPHLHWQDRSSLKNYWGCKLETKEEKKLNKRRSTLKHSETPSLLIPLDAQYVNFLSWTKNVGTVRKCNPD